MLSHVFPFCCSALLNSIFWHWKLVARLDCFCLCPEHGSQPHAAKTRRGRRHTQGLVTEHSFSSLQTWVDHGLPSSCRCPLACLAGMPCCLCFRCEDASADLDGPAPSAHEAMGECKPGNATHRPGFLSLPSEEMCLAQGLGWPRCTASIEACWQQSYLCFRETSVCSKAVLLRMPVQTSPSVIPGRLVFAPFDV